MSCAPIAVALGAAALWLPAAAQARPEAPPCTAEQGRAALIPTRASTSRRSASFTCVVDPHPTEVEGYRGRIEAELLPGRFSDAVRDYARVNAFVVPVHPDAERRSSPATTTARAAPDASAALTGKSFAYWWFFHYPAAIQLLDELLELAPGRRLRQPLPRLEPAAAAADRAGAWRPRARDRARPESPDVRYIVADAYTYGLPDAERAFDEATFALDGGLDTPRVHAILGSSLPRLRRRGGRGAQISATSTSSPRSSCRRPRSPPALADAGLVPGGPTRSRSPRPPARRSRSRRAATTSGTRSRPARARRHAGRRQRRRQRLPVAFDYTATTTGTCRDRVGFFESVITGVLTVTRR